MSEENKEQISEQNEEETAVVTETKDETQTEETELSQQDESITECIADDDIVEYYNEMPKTGDFGEEEDDFSEPVFFTREDVLGDETYQSDDEEKNKFSFKDFYEKHKISININWKKVLIPASAVFGLLLIAFSALMVYCLKNIPDDVIANNVYIETLNVGGLTYDEALESVSKTYLFQNQTVTLKSENQTYTINGVDVGLTASPEETTQKAFNYTKSGNKLWDGICAVKLMFSKHTIIPVAEIDQEKLDEKLREFGTQVRGEIKNHYVEIHENNVCTVWPGRSGFDGNVATARGEVLDAFKNDRFYDIYVTFNSEAPKDMTVGDFDLIVYKDPIDAYFEIKDGEVVIVGETNGRYIDKETVPALLKEVREGGEPVTVPWNTAYAEITDEDLEGKLFTDTLATYSTYYGNSTQNRSKNVSRAAELLNGALVLPGGIFSFNDKVGKRTSYNGFYTAPEYVNGETVQGIGGGTCQVSTTLYSAVLYAGLDIVSRTNHMFSVSYAPLGQDATVADSGVDFQFRNNTSYPVKIKARTDGSYVYVDIIGTKSEPPQSVKVDHSVSYGSGGTYVYSKRYIYENDECIKEEELPSSYYKKHETNETSETSKPIQTSKPIEPIGPIEPNEPNEPFEPSEPNEPIEPDDLA